MALSFLPLLALTALLTVPDPGETERLPLRVLYASDAGTPYSAAWQGFLAEHCEAVDFVPGGALTREQLEGYDVLVVDGEVEVKGEDGSFELRSLEVPLALDALQGFPVLLMGGQGGFLSDQLALKTSWRHG